MGQPSVHVVTTQGEAATTKDPEALRRDIANTRAEIGQTVDEIQRRLDPEVLKARARERVEEAKEHVKAEVKEQIAGAKHKVRAATVGRVENMVHRAGHDVREAQTSIVDRVRDNPIPAAMVGAGLAWLLIGGKKDRGRRPTQYLAEDFDPYGEYGLGGGAAPYYDESYPYPYAEESAGREGRIHEAKRKVQEVAGQAQHRVKEAAEHAQESASELAHEASTMAHEARARAEQYAVRARREARELGHQARTGARRAEQGFERTFRDNPMGVGLAALAIGAMVGLAVPRTRREDELMGEARDRLLAKGERLAQEGLEKVSDTAQQKLGTHGAGQSFAR